MDTYKTLDCALFLLHICLANSDLGPGGFGVCKQTVEMEA